jgi:hypothetical protein
MWGVLLEFDPVDPDASRNGRGDSRMIIHKRSKDPFLVIRQDKEPTSQPLCGLVVPRVVP